MQQDAARELASAINSALIHALRAVARQDPSERAGPAGLSALSVLVFAGPQRLGELARTERVAKATMSRVVDVLERDGLVRRRPDEEDGRAVWVETTAAGRKVLLAARDARIDRLAAAIERLPEAQQAVLRRAAPVLERLATELG